MKAVRFMLLLLLVAPLAQAQQKINKALKHELDSIYRLDQKYREWLSGHLDSARADSLVKTYKVEKGQLSMYLWKLQNEADSTNLIRIEQIIAKYGYPGRTLVGSPANEAVFYVIQHSPKIDKYLPLVEKAAKSKELPFHLYAMMLDRSLMYKGKEQVYGTQAKGFNAIDPKTGKVSWTFVIWPIADAANVNKRRKEAGFEQTVEQNAKRLGVDYKVYTLADINKMQGK